MFKLLGRKSACKTFAGSNEILRWLTPFWVHFGSKYGPQNGVQNWIPFSFLLLGLCLGPVLGSRFGPKSGASHRKILLLPADVLQADLRRTSMSVSVNTCFFSLWRPNLFLVQSRSLYGRHVSTSFLDPVFGAMMKAGLSPNTKVLAAECLVGVRLGRLNFLTPGLRGLIVLVACSVQVLFCFGQMSLTHFLDLGWWVGA